MSARLGLDVTALLSPVLLELTAAGCLESVDGRLRVTDGSILLTSEILVRLEVALADGLAAAVS